MKIKVLFFGRLNDVVKGDDEQIYENIYNTKDLLEAITRRFPSISDYTYKIAVNQEMILEDQVLNDNDEVALMPPFAGG